MVGTVEATNVHIFALRGRGDRMIAYDNRIAEAPLGVFPAQTNVVGMSERRRSARAQELMEGRR
jgi:hypothetical protein